MRTSLSPWTAALFSTLGISPLVACGGTVVERSNRAQTGGAGTATTGGVGGAGGTPWYGGGGFVAAGGYFGGDGAWGAGAALSSRSPLDIVRTTILEGCIGETVAAVEAAEGLAHATDPAVREALARVTMDETRHAELAWRFVQWVLTHGDAALRVEAASELVTLIESERGVHAPARGGESSQALAAHGVMSEATRSEIRRRVIDEIVLPCAHALVEESQKGARPSALAA